MPVQRLAPSAIVVLQNLSGSVGDLIDDPDSPDASWVEAISHLVDTVLRVDFPTPANTLQGGAGLQEFRLWVRKSAPFGDPTTMDVRLYLDNVFAATLAAGLAVTSDTGQLVSVLWNGAGIAGAQVQCQLRGHHSGGVGPERRTVEFGAVEWNAALVDPLEAISEAFEAKLALEFAADVPALAFQAASPGPLFAADVGPLSFDAVPLPSELSR